MNKNDYSIELCQRNDIKDFVETWHYSNSINGLRVDYCFKLIKDGITCGAIIYGKLAMANCWKKYGNSEDDVIELRRLCCTDESEKNSESFLVGRTLRWLINNTNIKTVVSYADPEYGHQGTIYKASNFKLVGRSSKGRVIFYNGKKYHDKCIRTYYNGELKPFAKKVKDALETGEAYYKTTEGKYIYLYNLDEHRSNKISRVSRDTIDNN